MGASVGYELFESVEVEISRAVATVRLLTTERVAVLGAQGSQAELHFDLGRRSHDCGRMMRSEL
ncbi:MAG: Enoyl-CoA hydratase/isomerase [Amycolatopsis sp.]|nr:Enoyl-CoA hydratase/isomerase [Amycolatopsis sp.]